MDERLHLEATFLFEDFFKAFDLMLRGYTEQIPLAYGLPNESSSF